ncbi:MAG: hypothetical protein JWO05_1554 [Gemmatimonadetes bacterium]|nr:hypothetical protein [Gemmatimonadota bacterium]
MGLPRWIDRLRRTSPRSAAKRVEAIAARVGRLTREEARIEANVLLRDRVLFRCDRRPVAPEDVSRVDSLPQPTRDLFAEYAVVETNSMSLAREAIAPYPRGRGFIRIGADLADAHVVVQMDSAVVSVVDDAGPNDLDLEDSHASIWHYLIFVSETSKPM